MFKTYSVKKIDDLHSFRHDKCSCKNDIKVDHPRVEHYRQFKFATKDHRLCFENWQFKIKHSQVAFLAYPFYA